MRVLITSPVFPPDLGGPSVYVPSFGRFMVERGHEVEVVAFCSDPDPQGHPFKVHAISRGRLAVRYIKAFFEVYKRAKGVDIVYVQEHLALLHVLAAKLRRKPVVIRIMVDGAWEISHRKGWIDGDNIVVFETKEYGAKVKFTRFLQKRWWKWCTRLISCSEFLRQICVQRYGLPGDKVVRIFNAYHGQPPTEAPATREAACEQLCLDTSKRYVLTICRLMVWKGVDGILRAMQELPDDAVLLIAGDGDMEDEWKRLAGELGLGDRARFLGNVPHAQIPAYIRAADVFVLNSEYEGLSHTLIEVATLGTATVCTGVCGNPEVVEDGVHGFTVPPKDDAALAEAIGKLLADKELRERFAERARADAGRFSREATFSRVEEVLTEAARR